jgi:hypothetical protein
VLRGIPALEHPRNRSNSIFLGNCRSNFTCTASAAPSHLVRETITMLSKLSQCFCARIFHVASLVLEHPRERANCICLKNCSSNRTCDGSVVPLHVVRKIITVLGEVTQCFSAEILHVVILALEHVHKRTDCLRLENCSSHFTCDELATPSHMMRERITILSKCSQCFSAQTFHVAVLALKHRRERPDCVHLENGCTHFTCERSVTPFNLDAKREKTTMFGENS